MKSIESLRSDTNGNVHRINERQNLQLRKGNYLTAIAKIAKFSVQ